VVADGTLAAAAVRGGRGSQLHHHAGADPQLHCSGRRPRRPRIATSSVGRMPCQRCGQRPPSAAAEDRNAAGGVIAAQQFAAAAAVRGGRGSQPCPDRPPLPHPPGSGRRPRRPRIATSTASLVRCAGPVAAAAVRGGRGSQHRPVTGVDLPARRSGRRPRRPRIATPAGSSPSWGSCPSSGRRPRRPRIATRSVGRVPRSRTTAAAAVRGGRGSQRHRLIRHLNLPHRQRPPSAAAEDRNDVLPVGSDGLSAAAAAVRGGRGSQHRHR